MDWFLYKRDLGHEKVKQIYANRLISVLPEITETIRKFFW